MAGASRTCAEYDIYITSDCRNPKGIEHSKSGTDKKIILRRILNNYVGVRLD
jgi:hypothetical protein